MQETATTIGMISTTVGLTIAIINFTRTLSKENRQKQMAEQRTEYKLRIHQLLINQNLTAQEIREEIQLQTPTKNIDQTEIRKSIYEMLIEKTITANTDETYTADTYDQDDDDQEEEEEEEEE